MSPGPFPGRARDLVPNKTHISICAVCDSVILTVGGIRFETAADSLAKAIAIAAYIGHELGIGIDEIAVLPEPEPTDGE